VNAGATRNSILEGFVLISAKKGFFWLSSHDFTEIHLDKLGHSLEISNKTPCAD
jgi:hypothetical protein